ncbi:hypothetical protein EDD21DRAFT_444384 [Dissophora ornata]|nr:hypothetical protein EDD21DRAFT_444384 [Dissophora ornata]
MSDQGYGRLLAVTLAATLSPAVLQELNETLGYLAEREKLSRKQEHKNSDTPPPPFNDHQESPCELTDEQQGQRNSPFQEQEEGVSDNHHLQAARLEYLP